MSPKPPHILLVNPWIHDFAAYDFWAKPLGLLTLGGILRQHGIHVSYIDCLDRFHPRSATGDPKKRFGRGPYLKRRISKPTGLKDVPRNYSRYGIPPEWFREALDTLKKPDMVLVTSVMTYWYPGVVEAIRLIKETYPDTPVILGGIYPTLCTAHTESCSGADRIVPGPADGAILDLVREYTSCAVKAAFDPALLDTYPFPAFDLQHRIGYIPLLTSRGCPFRCPYCASGVLAPERMIRSPKSVMEEIRFWNRDYGVVDFVFYDDALLVDAEHHAIPLLERVMESNLRIRFHTPNAVHIRGIDDATARLMFRAGFKTLRLGLETVGMDHRDNIDSKVTAMEFKNAATALRKAGFDQSQVGAYLLAGLPGQSDNDLLRSIETVKACGITPILAYYSPIPHTKFWEDAVAASRYDLTADPVFTNNAVFPCRKEGFSWDSLSRLKASISSSADTGGESR